MGLGILFLGYFLSTIVAIPFPEVGTLTGYLVMGYALTRLTQYEKWFSYSRLCAFLMVILAFPSCLSFVSGLFGVGISLPAFLVGGVFDYIESVGELLFHVSLYLSLIRLADGTGEEKLKLSSARNLFFYGLIFLLNSVFTVLAGIGGEIGKFASMALLVCALVYIVIIILNHVMLFTAYMWICDESDATMEIKDTGIAWLDKLRHKVADNEQRAADETQRYLQNRYDEKQRKSSGKKKKKKH